MTSQIVITNLINISITSFSGTLVHACTLISTCSSLTC